MIVLSRYNHIETQSRTESRTGQTNGLLVLKLSHTVWECKYHIVWIPKWNRKVIYGRLRKEIGQIIRKLYTIYGHVKLLAGIEREVALEEGGIVGSISGTEGKRLKILPHVHISVAWIPEDFPAENLDWKIMNESPDIILLNPLDIFNGNYTILQQT